MGLTQNRKMNSSLRARQGHDTLVYRLTEILVKLNRGEHLEPRALAAEFGVDLRTVQRDLNQRFAYLDLVKEQGRYRMNSSVLGRLAGSSLAVLVIWSRSLASMASISPYAICWPCAPIWSSAKGPELAFLWSEISGDLLSLFDTA